MKMSLATVPTQINFASQSNSYWYINAMPYNRNRRIIRFQRISHAPTKIPICYRLIHLSTFIWIIIMIFWFGLGCGRILNYEICHFQNTIQHKQHNPLIGINMHQNVKRATLHLSHTDTKRDESKYTLGIASTQFENASTPLDICNLHKTQWNFWENCIEYGWCDFEKVTAIITIIAVVFRLLFCQYIDVVCDIEH